MKIGSVFISHSVKEPDFSVASSLARTLKKVGLDVWWDKEGLECGDLFPVEILEAIIRQNFFIFIMSKNSISSNWCLRELLRATELGKDIKPFLLEPISPEKSPLEITGLQYVDISSGIKDSMPQILRALGIGDSVPFRIVTEDPFEKDGRLIKIISDQLNYAKTFTDSINMVLLLERIGIKCSETDRARKLFTGMRSKQNWSKEKIDYDRVRAYLLNAWRGTQC